ncbi:MAG: ABC transporter permease [Bacteroidales bacterium]|nr:ABC transporter permease [Bacteroidales bacterium]MCF8458237.1 ABC transporter permease [Bacteroidales bacterium]
MLIFRLLKESLLFAYNSLVVNKLRTFLSLLGITIGIFAIISVFTIIDTLEDSIRTSIESLGDNVVYIQRFPWEFSSDFPWWKYFQRPVPTLDELEQIKQRSKKTETAAYIAATNSSIQYHSTSMGNISTLCASHEYDKIWLFDIQEGRYFSNLESQSGRNVAVIGADIAENLFRGLDPIGRDFKMKGNKVRVVGVFKKEGNSIGQSLDKVVLLPVNYARTIFDIRSRGMDPFIMVKAKEGISINELMDELTGIMRSIRRIKPIAEDNFALNRASLIIKQFESVFGIISFAGAIIGGFSILVGAFGIANIMFVSVRERTSIIGIQKALGAKNYFILTQFLFESVILALIGGIIGLLLIFIGLQIANKQIDMDFALSLHNINLGLAISVVIGVVAGFMPAWKASKLNPVEAIQSTM